MRATAVILCAVLVAAQGWAQEATSVERFEQDRFAIGFWVDPPLDEKADARYEEIAGAHFNLVIGGFAGGDPDKLAHQIELCEKYDLRLLAHVRGLEPGDLPDSPVVWGYSLRDEPNASEFPDLRDKVDTVRALRPGKLGYINLFPNYASPWGQLGAETYDDYVAQFIDVVNPDVLSMDHYPIFKPDGDTRDNYIKDLAVMRENALRAGIPWWNFFNTMPYGPHTDPTEAQIRWQVFSSIAHGAKGVLYFCYYTPGPGGEFPKGGAIIERNDRRTRHYYHARRLNEQLKNLGPTLMKLTSTGVYRITSEDTAADILQGTPVRDIVRSEDHDPPNDYLVGVFSHEDGRRAVMLTNYRFAYSAWPTVVFDVPDDQVMEIDKWSGREVPAIDDSPHMDGLQLSLEDGEGRLFLLPPAK
jgi:catechol 2,3-dioxygenase-like lactoylglutathione lyase family enzyme